MTHASVYSAPAGLAQQDYLAITVQSADPVDLLSLLHGGLETAVRESRVALREGDIPRRSRSITRAVEILGELSASLDANVDPEFANRLNQLYEYMIWLLTNANVEQTEEPLREVERLAAILASAWRGLSATPRTPGCAEAYGTSALPGFSALG